MNTVKERLIEYLKYKGVSQGKFEKDCKLSNGYVNNIRKSISEDKMQLIKDSGKYDDINFSYIILGEGPIINKNIEPIAPKGNLVKAPNGKIKRRIKNDSGLHKIPVHNVDFEAGTGIEFFDDIRNSEPEYYMDVPDFIGCKAFRTYGKSMEPLIDSGAILFGTKEEDWRDYVEYGQIYGIILENGRRLLKRIRKSKKGEGFFLLESANPEYDERDIPIRMIRSVWLIHGWLNKRT